MNGIEFQLDIATNALSEIVDLYRRSHKRDQNTCATMRRVAWQALQGIEQEQEANSQEEKIESVRLADRVSKLEARVWALEENSQEAHP